MDLRTLLEALVAVAAVAVAVLAYDLGRRRTADRATIAGLQRALTPRASERPGVAIGSAVLSASPGVAVGGDIVDVFELDARLTLLLVADVSGKGIDAAAHTAFIAYTIRTLALGSDGDPAVVLATFNAMYPRTVHDPEAFVVLILGVLDTQTGEVRYASAGHEPAFVRRADGGLTLLAPTGPIVGISPYSAYAAGRVRLGAGDMLVWTTDGMTESRDDRRRLLGIDGLAEWIALAPRDVRAVAQRLVDALHVRSGGLEDDVAVLAVAWDPAAAAAERARVTRRGFSR